MDGVGYSFLDVGNAHASFNEPDAGVRPVVEVLTRKIMISDNKTITWNKVSEGELAMGSEVKCGDEYFYVIGFEDEGKTVKLLSKYSLDETGLYQAIEGASKYSKFASTNYWSSETNYPLDLNTYPIPSEVGSAVKAAQEYGESLGEKGRLMTKSEATELKGFSKDILYESYNTKTTKRSYWLGTTGDAEKVDTVQTGKTSNITQYRYSSTALYGIRPLIEIPKSKIQ